LKLSKAPNMRTVIIAVLAFILIGTAVDALARELRVTVGTDLGRCAAGIALTAGPDAGQVSAPGDTCVLLPGTYVPDTDADGDADTVYVTLPNLTIRSTNGATATAINCAGLGAGDANGQAGAGRLPVGAADAAACIVIQSDGVTIGGPKADQGITIFNAAAGFGGIGVGDGVPPAPAGQADENITIQNNIIRNNAAQGIVVLTAGAIETFRIIKNTIRDNGAQGILFDVAVTGIGRRGQDRNVIIAENFFEANTLDNISFFNNGNIENTAILNNEILRSVNGMGILFNNNGEIRDSLIADNRIQFNNVFGILFANTGRVSDLTINGNKGATPEQGITRNNLGGIVFFSAELRDVNITDNSINSNENVVALGVGGHGVLVATTGDVEGLTFSNNNVRQNGFSGFFKALGGDLSRSKFEQNVFRNNGIIVGGGFIALQTVNNFEENTFSGNEYREHSLMGFLALTTTGDISRNSYTNELWVKNTTLGMALSTLAGDISSQSFNGVQALENQAGPGSGAEITTITGDIEAISAVASAFNNNGGRGLRIASLGAPPARGDVTNVRLTNSQFNFNGTRAPRGLGSGIAIEAESIRDIVIDPSQANSNNDHGAQITASRDASDILVENSEFLNNDRNFDTVGNGIEVSVNESLDGLVVRGNKINDNNSGVRVSAQDRIGQDITIENNPEINNNRDAGVDLFGGNDLNDVTVSGNAMLANAIGIRVEVNDRGNNIKFTKNKIIGANGQGRGILLNSTGVTITENSIRNNATGIEVRRERDNKINKNNIARNENFGVDASALSPGTAIDATNNWWGEPSGPKHATNPGGIGDRVTDKVNFKPFLTEPAFKTEATFTVEFSKPDKDIDVTVGDSVTFEYTIKNVGTEEDTQTVTVTIKDGLGNVVNQFSRQVTVNPAGFRQDSFSFIFQTPGEYTVTVETAGDRKSRKVTVAGGAACLPFALDTNKNKVLDDAEIITAIDLWVKNGDVPGCSPPLKISDTQIIQLIDLWVKGSQLTVPLGGKMTSQSATLSVASTFATLGASVRAVRPGDSFTVTVSVDAKDGISGLLLSQALPAGWSAKPIQMSGAYYKASENKWLWLNAKGTVSVSYEVTVPATAQPGLYTIAGRVKAAVPGIESELQPLTIEVLGAPVALAVKAITLSQQPVRTGGAYFIVEGVGIAQTTVRVFSLTGKLVFSQTAQGNVVPFSAAAELANGVYLYVVTVQGADGQTVTSKIAKLVVLR
jgi:parallel beta-helix repeat protein